MYGLKVVILLVSLNISAKIIIAENKAAKTPVGIIKGKVVIQISKEPLYGANIRVVSRNEGAASNVDGEFEIGNIPAGFYNIECSYIGFRAVIKTEISVKPGKTTFLEFELSETGNTTKEVQINSGYFGSNLSGAANAVEFNSQEIRRAPGSADDVSRILVSLPSAAKTADNNNDLAVRGGSPAENGFYLDNIPVPNINHFPNEGSTGGAIGLLNINFIDNVSYYTSGFNSSFGNRLSSIIDIKLREGNKEKVNTSFDLNFSGFNINGEGPIGENTGSWLFSARRSYLDFLVNAIGTGTAPRYGDVQGKISLDLNKKHKISILEILGFNSIESAKDKSEESGAHTFGKSSNCQFTTGANWRALWNDRFYSNTSLTYSFILDNAEYNKTLTNTKRYSSSNFEAYSTFRNVNFYNLSQFHKTEFGIEVKFNNANYDYSRFSDTNRLGQISPDYFTKAKISSSITGLFFDYMVNPFKNIGINIGLRGDYYSLTKKTSFSPRFSISYNESEALRIFGSAGIFYQELPMIITAQKDEFKSLERIKAYHLGFGFDYFLSEDTKLTVEFYDKKYENMPLYPKDPSLSVLDGGSSNQGFKNYESLVTIGEAYTRGVELLIQKKLSDEYYGMVSASFFKSQYKDFNGLWHDRMYDNRVIFCIVMGYKPDNSWEYGLKWVYAGGAPYTPFDIPKSIEYRTGIISQNEINNSRFKDYHSLNIRIDKKFYFNTQYLDIYISVWNLYNNKNVASYSWNSIKNEMKTSYQWGILPIAGIEYSF